MPDPQFPKHHTYFVRALGKVREARRKYRVSYHDTSQVSCSGGRLLFNL